MFTTVTLQAIITLEKIVPLIVEGTCLLIIFIIAAFLSAPLISHMSIYFRSCGSSGKENSSDVTLIEGETYPLSMPNYPPLPSLPSADVFAAPVSTPELSIFHVTHPTSVNRSSEEMSAEESCIPVSETATNRESEHFLALVPEKADRVINASHLVNYDSYRHKLIEETLQKRYGGGYAPGNVILNLIQLNMSDSAASVMLAKKYDGSFFEHIRPQDDAAVAADSFRPDLEHPDPLAHFIPRNLRKPSTLETETETADPSKTSVIEKVAAVPSRPTTPGSCQRIISRRFHDGSLAKSPFATPVHSQAPLNTHASLTTRTRDQRSDALTPGRTEEQFICSTPIIVRRREAPLTEQLYRRNDAGPDVVSKTHVEAEEYLNRIARNKRSEVATTLAIKQPSIRSSLKKSRQSSALKKSFNNTVGGKVDGKTGDCNRRGSIIRAADIRHLSTSKPTVWNN